VPNGWKVVVDPLDAVINKILINYLIYFVTPLQWLVILPRDSRFSLAHYSPLYFDSFVKAHDEDYGIRWVDLG
jgi:hypothetical protein